MFDSLQERLSGIFDKLTGRGALSEADVDAALREVRRALLEADVALDVVKGFTEKVREKAVGGRHAVGGGERGEVALAGHEHVAHLHEAGELRGGEPVRRHARASPTICSAARSDIAMMVNDGLMPGAFGKTLESPA